jgi:hypothetical protein
LRERKFLKVQAQGIDNGIYREAMKIGEYNTGRTVANISRKTWLEGLSDKLRPDTMWADERYVDINQKEINEAKARITERKKRKEAHSPAAHQAGHHDHGQEHGHDHSHGHGHGHEPYDWKKIQVSHEPPLYP